MTTLDQIANAIAAAFNACAPAWASGLRAVVIPDDRTGYASPTVVFVEPTARRFWLYVEGGRRALVSTAEGAVEAARKLVAFAKKCRDLSEK